MNKVGRPIVKIGRTKIGLSIDGQTNSYLCQLADETGKTKSRIVEDAIKMFYEEHLDTMEKLNKVRNKAVDLPITTLESVKVVEKLEVDEDDPYASFRTMLEKRVNKE